MFTTIWNLWWMYGWAGFLGISAWMLTGIVVYFNALSHADDNLRFFRFLVFSAVCGPIAWVIFPLWLAYKMISLVDVRDIGSWLSGKN